MGTSRLRHRALIASVAAIAVLGGIRVALTPRRIPRAEVARDAPALARAGAALQASVLDREGLVGSLLHARDGRPAVLLLELPARVQRALDEYRDGGDGAALASGNDRPRARPWPRRPSPWRMKLGIAIAASTPTRTGQPSRLDVSASSGLM